MWPSVVETEEMRNWENPLLMGVKKYLKVWNTQTVLLTSVPPESVKTNPILTISFKNHLKVMEV